MSGVFLPLVGHNMDGDDNDSSDSEDGFVSDEQVDPDADPERMDSESNDEDEEGKPVGSNEKEDGSRNQPLTKKEKHSKKHSIPNITFDKFLPGTHSYLGNDLEEVRGRTVHAEESYQSLPILSLPGVVLVPGQTLPLHLFQPSTATMMRRLIEGDKTFGLVPSRYLGHDQLTNSVGTTAEILAFKEESDSMTGISTVRVKGIGRQRFEIKDTHRQIDGIIMARVRILPERELDSPLEGATPNSYRRLIGYDKQRTSGLDMTHDHLAILKQWIKENKNCKKKVDRFSSAHFTWWPPWVYKQYDTQLLIELVKKELTSWNDTLREDSMPQDATEFSFWVAGNLPLDDGLKLHLLKMDSAIQRLRCELSIMKKCTVLCCKQCGLLIAKKNDVFSMAVEGPMAAYCNPAGYVHETFTVYKAQGLNLIGRPSTENSWFPGYAWTIIQCRNCSRHMGWKFTAVKRKLQPEKFWGLCRSSLLPGLQNEDEASEGWIPTQ